MGKGSKNSRRRKSDPNARPVGQSFTSGAAQRRRRRHRERDNRRWREFTAKDGAGDAQDETQEMIQEDLYEFPEREPMEAKRRRRARGGWQARQKREWMEQQSPQQEPKRPKTAFSGPTWSTSRFGRKSRKSKAEEPKVVTRPRQGVYSGQLKNISPKGFGFIGCRETWKDYGRDVLVYPEEVGNVKEGDSIDFHVKLEEGAKGPRPIGYDLVRKERTVKVINDVKPPLSVFAKSVPEPLGEPPWKVPEPLGEPPRKEVKLHPRPKPSSAPKLPPSGNLGAELTELQKRWRKLEEDRDRTAAASAPRSYHVRPSEPLRGPKGHEVNAQITGSCSPPKPFPNVYGIQAEDTKKRNFDELFEKTKALLEKKEVKVAPSQANEARYGRKKPQAAPSVSPSTSRPPSRWNDQSSEVLLLLDVVPNSALLVQSVRDEILSRPGISNMHFAQPEGNLLAPWRAEILGAHGALEEVKTFLIDTLEFEAVRVVGFDKPSLEDESNLCVTVKGLQEAFGQGGACAALMACGRVLQWIKAGEEAFCWLASAEAVWVAQQFLHGATSSNGKESSVVPDAATQEAVNSWRERRRSALAKPRGAGGSWRRATEEELDIELLNDSGVQAAKARLEDFLCYVAEQDI